MALDTAFYLVTRDIAIRSGVVDVRYRTLDGRFILDNKDLSRVRFTTDEYVSGLKGVEMISEAEAQTLIAQGGYKKGLGVENPNKELPTGEEEEPVEDNEAPSEETNEVDGTKEEETATEPTEQEQTENDEDTNEKEEEE